MSPQCTTFSHLTIGLLKLCNLVSQKGRATCCYITIKITHSPAGQQRRQWVQGQATVMKSGPDTLSSTGLPAPQGGRERVVGGQAAGTLGEQPRWNPCFLIGWALRSSASFLVLSIISRVIAGTSWVRVQAWCRVNIGAGCRLLSCCCNKKYFELVISV